MARLEYFIVSKSMSVDIRTNQTSLFEVLEEIQAPAFPAVLPQCVAVTLWRKEEGDEDQDFQSRLVVTTPSGNTILRISTSGFGIEPTTRDLTNE